MASLGKNIAANYIGKTWTALLGILCIPFYLRFMGIEAYGLIGFYAVLSSVLGILDLGIGSTLNRELARLSASQNSAAAQRDAVRTFEAVYWAIAVFAGGMIILAAPYISHTWIKPQDLHLTDIFKAIQLMGIAVAFQFPMSLYQGGLMGLERQVLANVILIFTGTLRSVGAIFALWLISPTIEIFLAWQIAVSILGSMVFFLAMWRCLPGDKEPARFRGRILYDVRKYALAISANAVIGVILTQLDKVILSNMLTLKMFGYYSLAATAASAIWMVIIPFNIAIFPRFVQLEEAKRLPELKILFHRSSQILSLILFPVCALLIVFSRQILFLWMHDPFIVENCYLIMSLLVFGTMLNGVASIPGYSASAFGWPQLITYTNIIQAIILVPLIVVLVFWFQGVGAAIAWAVLNCTYIIFMVPVYFRRYLGEEQRGWYLQDVAIPAFTAFSICALSLSFSSLIHAPLAVWGWIIITAMISLFATGLSLPHVRSLAYTKSAFLFIRKAPC